MAKAKTNKEEEVILVADEPKEEEVTLISNETLDKIEQIRKEEEEVTITEQENKPVIKNVKVVLKENHRCNIGGNWYSFQAGKYYNVPENVKTILKGADLLAPL